MDDIKNLLVGLDMTPMDDSEITYAAFLCSQTGIEQVHFIYVEETYELPNEILKSSFEKDEDALDAMATALREKVQAAFKHLPHISLEFKVLQGDSILEILKIAKAIDADMLLVGKKMQLTGSGSLPRKLLRASRMSMLFIPEHTEPVLRKIVVSTDFNEYSALALDQMLRAGLTQPSIAIECLHVYEVPTGYFTLGQSYEEFDMRMQEHSREKFNEILEPFPELRGRVTLNLVKKDEDVDIGELIVLEARRSEADLLVIGAAGKSPTALFLLGSTTEKILDNDNDLPLMIFKRKDEKLGFLEALLRED